MTIQEKINTLTSASSTVQYDIVHLEDRRRQYKAENVEDNDPVIKLIDNILEKQKKTYNDLRCIINELIERLMGD